MNDASPFLDLDPSAPRVRVRFDGRDLDLPEGISLAAALIGAGIASFRTNPGSGAPRGPFCMMGACQECVVRIDGIARQACMVEVRAGLVVERADREATPDARD